MGDELKKTRRNLPHWTIDGAIYFVTFRSYIILSPVERMLVLDHLQKGNGQFYTLIAGVVMSDHVHILVSPETGYALDRVMKGIKGVSARKINLHRRSIGQIWQHESYDHIIRDGKELKIKFNYIVNNPVKAGYVDRPQEYAGLYCNEKIIV